MNQAIDQRDDPRGFREIRRHVRTCESCACELNAWIQIQSLYDPVVPKSDKALVPWGILAMTAASLAFGALGTYFTFRDRPEDLVSIQSSPIQTPPSDSKPIPSTPLPSTPLGSSPADCPSFLPAAPGQATAADGVSVKHWLTQVDTDAWIDQTMPAVRNVGEGVAPLGRSIQQAVSILMPKHDSAKGSTL